MDKDKLEIKSLNTEIYDDFDIEELERRLEFAKPWICIGYCEDFDVEIET